MPFCKYCDEYVADDENACLDNDYRYSHPQCEDDHLAKEQKKGERNEETEIY